MPFLSYTFTKFKVNCTNNILVPLFHMYPCYNIDVYCDKVDMSVKRMIKGPGLKMGHYLCKGFIKMDISIFF